MKFTTISLLLATALTLTACEYTPDTSARTQEQQTVAANQKALLTDTALPTLRTSLERKNIKERLERINQQNMSGFVYLISQGSIIASYPVRGKVSSLRSYLTPGDKIVNDPYGSMDAGGQVVEAPDLDGAYGDNTDGIFFFTADTNAYVEWHGDYIFTDQFLSLNQQPRLERQVK